MATIRQLRDHQGWSQYELALRVGVHPHTVYLWEHGRRTPKVVQMRTLGSVFGLCSDEIDLEPHHDPGESHQGKPESLAEHAFPHLHAQKDPTA
jgi:DNA-binding XRE family transcriptional regulator